jgi:DNA-3-methyladenine glycosylase II
MGRPGYRRAAKDNDGILQAGTGMGLDRETLKAGLDQAADREPAIARALALTGYPEPRINERGYRTLLRTIVGQQVSTASARSVWTKLQALLGDDIPPQALLDRSFDELRGCGLSRQKQGYVRSLCDLVVQGELDLAALPAEDEDAIAALTKVKGIGRWSAEIYLLFAEGRPDIWPAGDLGVQAGLQRILALPERPDEKRARAMAEGWRPHRGAVAIFTWHCYDNPTL